MSLSASPYYHLWPHSAMSSPCGFSVPLRHIASFLFPCSILSTLCDILSRSLVVTSSPFTPTCLCQTLFYHSLQRLCVREAFREYIGEDKEETLELELAGETWIFHFLVVLVLSFLFIFKTQIYSV